MPIIDKIKSGYEAKKRGQSFENLLRAECHRQSWACCRIEDGAKTIGKGQIRRTTQMCDFVIAKNGIVILIDTKTTKANTYSSSMINGKQAFALSHFEANGILAGYLINFDTLNKTVFFKSSLVMKCFQTRNTSLRPEMGLEIGNNNILNLKTLIEKPKPYEWDGILKTTSENNTNQ